MSAIEFGTTLQLAEFPGDPGSNALLFGTNENQSEQAQRLGLDSVDNYELPSNAGWDRTYGGLKATGWTYADMLREYPTISDMMGPTYAELQTAPTRTYADDLATYPLIRDMINGDVLQGNVALQGRAENLGKYGVLVFNTETGHARIFIGDEWHDWDNNPGLLPLSFRHHFLVGLGGEWRSNNVHKRARKLMLMGMK